MCVVDPRADKMTFLGLENLFTLLAKGEETLNVLDYFITSSCFIRVPDP